MDLKLPFSPGSETNGITAAASEQSEAATSAPAVLPSPGQPAGTGAALLGRRRAGLGGLGTLLPMPRGFGSQGAAAAVPTMPYVAAAEQQPGGGSGSDGGHFMLRCGQLLMSAEVRTDLLRPIKSWSGLAYFETAFALLTLAGVLR